MSHPLHFDDTRCTGRWSGAALAPICANCQRREAPPPFHDVSWIDPPPASDDEKCAQKI